MENLKVVILYFLFKHKEFCYKFIVSASIAYLVVYNLNYYILLASIFCIYMAANIIKNDSTVCTVPNKRS